MPRHRHSLDISFKVDGRVEEPDIYGALYGQTRQMGPGGLSEPGLGSLAGRMLVRISPTSDASATVGTIRIPLDAGIEDCQRLSEAISSIKNVGSSGCTFVPAPPADSWEAAKSSIREGAKTVMSDWFPSIGGGGDCRPYRIRLMFEIAGPVDEKDVQGSVVSNVRVLGGEIPGGTVEHPLPCYVGVQMARAAGWTRGTVVIPIDATAETCSRLAAAVEMIDNVGSFECRFRLDSVMDVLNEIDRRASAILDGLPGQGPPGGDGKRRVIALSYLIYGDVTKGDILGALFDETAPLGTGGIQGLKDRGLLGFVNTVPVDAGGACAGTLEIPVRADIDTCARLAAAVELAGRVKEADSVFQLRSIGGAVCGGGLSAYGPSRLACGPDAVDSGWIILVEGRADVRSLLSAGYGNAIEIGGARVDSSVKNLCKIKGIVVAFLDGDDAGGRIMEKLKSVIRVDRELRADPGLEVEEMDAGRIRAVLEPVAAGLGAAAASGGTAPSQAGPDLYGGGTGGRDMDKKAGDAKPDDDKPEPFNRGNDEYWHSNEED